jgi:dihydroorotate dehydrogenase electron transfer subunit
MTVEYSVITSKKNIAKDIYDIWLYSPKIAQTAKPGQFVNVKCNDFTLRRPISICEIDKENGRIRLVFQVKGAGTQWLAGKNENEVLDLLGPLGKDFPIEGKTEAIFVGGGIGVPPLLAAAKPFGAKATVILGFRTAGAVILKDSFENQGANVIICTDDGTTGIHGFVTDALKEVLTSTSTVFACGPRPMLKATAACCEKVGADCFVSMEERMACGTGACLSCACKVKVLDSEKYLHVCKDGPVFDAKTIVW